MQAALQWGKRPTVMLMQDEWYGHRDALTDEPEGDKEAWIDWDFALAAAFQTVEAYTGNAGIMRWQNEDPAENIGAKRQIDRFQAAVEEKTKAKNYKPANGEYFTPILQSTRKDKKLWTYMDWREAQLKEMLAAQSKVE